MKPIATQAPIFVGGTGRSGTTVVAQLLGSHPEIACIPHQLKIHAEPLGLPGLIGGVVSREELAQRLRHEWFDQTPQGSAGGLQKLVDKTTLEAAVQAFEQTDDPTLAARALIEALVAPHVTPTGRPRWVEMSPRNVFHADALVAAFPQARIVHVMRDGRDTAASLAARGWVADEREGLEWWARRCSKAERATRPLPSAALHVVHLEDLAGTEQAAVCERLLDFLDLRDADGAVHEFISKAMTVERAKVGRWREGKSAAEIKRIDRHYRELIDEHALPVDADRVVALPARRSHSEKSKTGVVDEHFVPDDGATIESYLKAGNRTAVHHLIRYSWACEVLAEVKRPIKRLLDVACGAGYGSVEIATRLSHTNVVGADYDQSAVALAQETYSRPNLEFRRGDVELWEETLGAEEYDCIVSFDTIEHVAHREIMMQNLVDHLSPKGMLLLSTPVRRTSILNPGWEHHKLEYGAPALYDFLRRYFKVVLTPEGGTLPRADVIDELNSSGETVYLMRMNPVVCLQPIRVSRP